MFYLVGLKDNGNLALCDRRVTWPSDEELENLAIGFHYVQMMVFGDGIIKRYEYDSVPKLREVPHFG